MDVSPAQVVAFRLAAQQVAPRGSSPLEVLGGWAVQDSPSGSAAVALATRSGALDAGWLDAALHDERTAVALYNPRTATAVVPAAEVAAYTAGLLGRDEDELRHVLGRAIPPAGDGIEPAAAVAAALPAFEDALDQGPLSRDDLHAALRERLPGDLLPWCDGCKSHHARRGLLVTAGLHGRLCIAGRAGRQPLFARTDRWLGSAADPTASSPDAAAAELVRRFLRGYGPAAPQLLADWAGVSRGQARRMWRLVEDELAEVTIARGDGTNGRGRSGGASGSGAWLLRDDVERVAAAVPPTGVILLPAGDPLLLARDRELLVPDPLARRQVWAAINMPGVVLVDGAAVATWRGRKRGRRLDVELRPLGGPLSNRAVAAVEREASRLAPHRGCTSAAVTAS
ncbi:MAG TPA: winged helix DNA-binding domain-containing protein [Conexibacter sp.]